MYILYYILVYLHVAFRQYWKKFRGRITLEKQQLMCSQLVLMMMLQLLGSLQIPLEEGGEEGEEGGHGGIEAAAQGGRSI